MKKILISSLVFLIMMVVVWAAYDTAVPTSGTLILNTTNNYTFSINNTANMSGGALYIDTVNVGALSCNETLCNRTQNLSAYGDGVHTFYFITSPSFESSNTSNFTIDRPPISLTTFNVSRVNITALNITWNTTESDIQGYNLYRANTSGVVNNATFMIANYTTLTSKYYTDDGLTAAVTYFYLIEAVDNRNQTGAVSSMINETVADSTAPVVPTITPASGATLNTTNPSINIYYADPQNVTLRIYSGDTLVKDF